MKFKKRNLIFSIITIISIVILCEVVLQVLSFTFPSIDILLSKSPKTSIMIKDIVLETRPNPEYPGHDQKGFRNKLVPDKVSIVAMGDSQTYGMGVKANDAWPQMLGKLAEIKTYNMAWGGYGPAHSVLLWEEAIDLKPKLVIEAFYAGNDLYDSYHLLYDMKQIQELKTTDKNIIKTIDDAEKIEPLAEKIEKLFTMGRNRKNNSAPTRTMIREFFINHAKLYGILRATKRILENSSSDFTWKLFKQRALWNEEYCQIIERDNIKTILTPKYRLCAVNLNDPRIAEGHRVSLEAIRLMKERALKVNIEFMVLLIPTKEMVFKNVVYEDLADDIPEVYKTIIENEELLWGKTKIFLNNKRVDFIDALPILRECVRNGIQPYKLSWDGHLNAIGHRAIAELVNSEIEKHDYLFFANTH